MHRVTTPMILAACLVAGCASIDPTRMSDYELCKGVSSVWGNGIIPPSMIAPELQRRAVDCTPHQAQIEAELKRSSAEQAEFIEALRKMSESMQPPPRPHTYVCDSSVSRFTGNVTTICR